MRIHRALAFRVPWHDSRLAWLLTEFRLIVNESIRIALRGDIRSRNRLVRAAYEDLSRRHAVYKQYIPSAFEVALAALKGHRRRVKRGRKSSVPYVRRLFLKAENQSYRLDRRTGHLCIPICARQYVELNLALSDWHQRFLGDPTWGLGSLTIVPGKAVVIVRKEPPKQYEPQGAIALDTNEDSLDGVLVSGVQSRLLTVPRMASATSKQLISSAGGASPGRRRMIAESVDGSLPERVCASGTAWGNGCIWRARPS